MPITFSQWNQQQKTLRNALDDPTQFDRAGSLALSQHAWTHESAVSATDEPTFADQLWAGLDADTARLIPAEVEHSIAWLTFHLARIEDTAMNILIEGTPMVLDRGSWLEKMQIEVRHTGNLMPAAEIAALSQSIEIHPLRQYRNAVGKRTREIIQSLTPQRLLEKVHPKDIQQVRDQAAVLPEAEDLLTYWSKRTIAGLLLMPATRHNIVHINEALRLKAALQKNTKN